MTKTLLPALAALLLVATSAKADDSLEFDLDSISDADISVVEVDFDIDVDALEADAEEGLLAGEGSELEEAIAACWRRYRRCGFGYRGYGYRSWGYGGYGYRSYYRPFYRSCYRPVVRYCAPIYRSYWGCY